MVLTTLARISLFPHLGIAYDSLDTLFDIIRRDHPTFTLLPSPIFPSSSPHQQYSGLSFLAALTKKRRIVFSEFQANLPTDPSHLPKYIQLTNDDPDLMTSSTYFCLTSILLPTLLLRATPSIEVDSEIIRELILFVKEALTTILTHTTTVDNLIASLPSDSSLTTPLDSDDDTPMADSLEQLHSECELFLYNGWRFFIEVTFQITEPHKSSFQTIILDDPSFPDLILNSLKLNHKTIKEYTVALLANIVKEFPSVREQFMTTNLVGRMFETVDFVSLPLSEYRTHHELATFLGWMFTPIGDDEEADFEGLSIVHQQFQLKFISIPQSDNCEPDCLLFRETLNKRNLKENQLIGRCGAVRRFDAGDKSTEPSLEQKWRGLIVESTTMSVSSKDYLFGEGEKGVVLRERSSH
ncbi:hypothetical protein BLNAU_3905 [Blattamonas nauphoetae]|uniref:Uncharacterized protein n=1 Tax=Blattamonas nauphoetae TaxID=2049346 RepID=A0ABQ9YBJ4_9EUKA|nr:hypothetical protein BLNAU_3905 [Blattamonas nauphoetae]